MTQLVAALAGTLLLCMVLGASSASWPDCAGAAEEQAGPHAELDFHKLTYDGTQFYALKPRGAGGPWPLLVFMHGSTGQFGMYAEPPAAGSNATAGQLHPLNMYASHGFVVIFPFVKSPEKDKSPFTTNTDGEFIIKGLEFARAAQSDSSSPLKGAVDLDSAISMGHSMGATCSIMAGKRLPAGTLKAVVTQHPGICGPFGPPPWPSTWMGSDLAEVNKKVPLLFTTATNDGAFWPAPRTAEHEMGCFKNAAVPGPAAFVQFSAAACNEDHRSEPWTDGGHDCPFKPLVETPWVLRFVKLYGQLGGDSGSQCHGMVWGGGSSSLRTATSVEQSIVLPPASLVVV